MIRKIDRQEYFMKIFGLIAGCVFVLIYCCGCCCFDSGQVDSNDVMYAKYTSDAIEVDGHLDEAVWGRCECYPMYLCGDRAVDGRELEEGGYVKLSWDEEYLYVGVLFKDSEIKAEGQEDNLAHFMLGDVCELFVKPEGHKWYWEMYGTPVGKKTCYFLKEHRAKPEVVTGVDLQVGAFNYGSVNNGEDRDDAYCVEMAVALKDLWRGDEGEFSKCKWRILVARYNYSSYLFHESPEYSSSPGLSKTDYHLLEEYSDLLMIK